MDEDLSKYDRYVNSHELKHRLEQKLLDPNLTDAEKKEVKSAIETYFDI